MSLFLNSIIINLNLLLYDWETGVPSDSRAGVWRLFWTEREHSPSRSVVTWLTWAWASWASYTTTLLWRAFKAKLGTSMQTSYLLDLNSLIQICHDLHCLEVPFPRLKLMTLGKCLWTKLLYQIDLVVLSSKLTRALFVKTQSHFGVLSWQGQLAKHQCFIYYIVS